MTAQPAQDRDRVKAVSEGGCGLSLTPRTSLSDALPAGSSASIVNETYNPSRDRVERSAKGSCLPATSDDPQQEHRRPNRNRRDKCRK